MHDNLLVHGLVKKTKLAVILFSMTAKTKTRAVIADIEQCR